MRRKIIRLAHQERIQGEKFLEKQEGSDAIAAGVVDGANEIGHGVQLTSQDLDPPERLCGRAELNRTALRHFSLPGQVVGLVVLNDQRNLPE